MLSGLVCHVGCVRCLCGLYPSSYCVSSCLLPVSGVSM